MLAVLKEIIINTLPFGSKTLNTFYANKYFDRIRIKGKNVKTLGKIRISECERVVLGDNVIFEGNNFLDSEGGILIGDNVIVKKGVNMYSSLHDQQYCPVVVGAGNTVHSHVNPNQHIGNLYNVNSLVNFKGEVVFVVSTGRSGTKTIASLLNQHPCIQFHHDSYPHIHTYAQNLQYKKNTQSETIENIRNLYNAISINNCHVYGQSDQKLAALITELATIYPASKFIWLLRNPIDFINSSYPRGWFANSEFGYNQNNNEFVKKEFKPRSYHAYHRLNGYLLGVFSIEEWKNMTAFERLCWYWTYWNSMIEKKLESIDSSRHIKILLNQLFDQVDCIVNFLNIESHDFQFTKTNKAKYKKLSTNQWNKNMWSIYNKWCTSKYEKWFS